MDNENSIQLSKYRSEKSKECLNSAKALRDLGDFKGAANRAYHAIRSILALDMVEFKRHSGNMSYFRQNYIKTGIFDIELSDFLTIASEARNSSDYDDFYIISRDEVNNQIDNAERLCKDVESYLSKRYNNDA